MTAEARAPRAGVGILMMLGAWFLFALTDTSAKWLALLGLPALQLAFMRYFVHLLLSLGSAGRSITQIRALDRRQIALLFLRAALLVTATLFNFIALKHLSLTVTSAIMFSAPIIVSALAVPLLGERVGPVRWAAIILGFVGVLIVIRPFGTAFHWAAGLVVYNAVALAFFSILTRKLSGAVTPQTMQIFMGVLGTAVLLPAALWVWVMPETVRDWAVLVGVGAFAWAGHGLFARAHEHATASVLMPYAYSFILYMTATSFLVFGAVPDPATGLGALVIVAAGLIIWVRERQVTEGS